MCCSFFEVGVVDVSTRSPCLVNGASLQKLNTPNQPIKLGSAFAGPSTHPLRISCALSERPSKFHVGSLTVPTFNVQTEPRRNIGGVHFSGEDVRPVVLFDGVCNLCNKWVNFLLDWDPEGKLRFASLDSDAGQQLLVRSGRESDDKSDIVLVERDRAYFGSDAVVRMASYLALPLPFVSVVGAVTPKGIRDAVYKAVSENRHKLFANSDACRLFHAGLRGRFLS